MKKIGFVLFVLLNSLLVFGNESISVGILNGPSAIPIGYMKENVEKINNADLIIEKFADPKALLPKLIKKEVDIGFLPVNVAAKVFNSSNGAIKCCAVTGNGNIGLVTKDKSIKRLSDLEGKKVYVAGKGATPDYLFRYLLSENEIDISEEQNRDAVELDYSIPTNQLAAMLVSDKIKYAVIPEPFISAAQLKSKKVRVAIDFEEEYKTVTRNVSSYPLTVMVVTKEFAEENGELLEEFLEKYEDSYEWTVENPHKAGSLSEKHQLGFNQAIAVKAIPRSNYCFVEAEDGRADIESFLNLFLQYAPESIGGKLPADEFYYSETEEVIEDIED